MAKLWRGLHPELPSSLVQAVESLSAMSELEAIKGYGTDLNLSLPSFKQQFCTLPPFQPVNSKAKLKCLLCKAP